MKMFVALAFFITGPSAFRVEVSRWRSVRTMGHVSDIMILDLQGVQLRVEALDDGGVKLTMIPANR